MTSNLLLNSLKNKFIKIEKYIIAKEGDNRIDDMLSLFNAGDAIEFITKDNQSHWVLYVGKNHCVHLIQDQVRKEDVRSIYKGCQVRIVNNVYVFKALPIVQILQNAESQVNNLSKWSNSECFTMWCRTNKNEFTSSYFAHKNLDDSSNNSKYTLSLKIDDESITKTFPSLSKLIEFRKKIELPFYKKLNYTSVTKS